MPSKTKEASVQVSGRLADQEPWRPLARPVKEAEEVPTEESALPEAPTVAAPRRLSRIRLSKEYDPKDPSRLSLYVVDAPEEEEDSASQAESAAKGPGGRVGGERGRSL